MEFFLCDNVLHIDSNKAQKKKKKKRIKSKRQLVMFKVAVEFFGNLTSNKRVPFPASNAFIYETIYGFLVHGPSFKRVLTIFFVKVRFIVCQLVQTVKSHKVT